MLFLIVSIYFTRNLRRQTLAVTRTRDGGKALEPLRDGLPRRHAYDLVRRHGLDMDASGTTLAFGSTTGDLRISGDRSAHWQQPYATLPPIDCVRFAR